MKIMMTIMMLIIMITLENNYNNMTIHYISQNPCSVHFNCPSVDESVVLYWRPGWVPTMGRQIERFRKWLYCLLVIPEGTFDHYHTWSISYPWHCACNVLDHDFPWNIGHSWYFPGLSILYTFILWWLSLVWRILIGHVSVFRTKGWYHLTLPHIHVILPFPDLLFGTISLTKNLSPVFLWKNCGAFTIKRRMIIITIIIIVTITIVTIWPRTTGTWKTHVFVKLWTV